ncbi:MAG: hypothetical protein IJU39_06650 [Clostridia bacterium]|nr:hypothetical protein [Clostridia bacterium]
MKKFISILLIVAMMATTFAVIFAGTVTAFAEDKTTTTTTKATTTTTTKGPMTKDELLYEIDSKIYNAVITVVVDILKSVAKGGVFNFLIDDAVKWIQTNILTVNGLTKLIQSSAILKYLGWKVAPSKPSK